MGQPRKCDFRNLSRTELGSGAMVGSAKDACVGCDWGSRGHGFCDPFQLGHSGASFLRPLSHETGFCGAEGGAKNLNVGSAWGSPGGVIFATPLARNWVLVPWWEVQSTLVFAVIGAI